MDTKFLWYQLSSENPSLSLVGLVSNEQLLRETQMRFITSIVHEHQLRLYGQVACFPDADPAYQILSAREPREWRRPTGRPHALWLQ